MSTPNSVTGPDRRPVADVTRRPGNRRGEGGEAFESALSAQIDREAELTVRDQREVAARDRSVQDRSAQDRTVQNRSLRDRAQERVVQNRTAAQDRETRFQADLRRSAQARPVGPRQQEQRVDTRPPEGDDEAQVSDKTEPTAGRRTDQDRSKPVSGTPESAPDPAASEATEDIGPASVGAVVDPAVAAQAAGAMQPTATGDAADPGAVTTGGPKVLAAPTGKPRQAAKGAADVPADGQAAVSVGGLAAVAAGSGQVVVSGQPTGEQATGKAAAVPATDAAGLAATPVNKASDSAKAPAPDSAAAPADTATAGSAATVAATGPAVAPAAAGSSTTATTAADPAAMASTPAAPATPATPATPTAATAAATPDKAAVGTGVGTGDAREGVDVGGALGADPGASGGDGAGKAQSDAGGTGLARSDALGAGPGLSPTVSVAGRDSAVGVQNLVAPTAPAVPAAPPANAVPAPYVSSPAIIALVTRIAPLRLDADGVHRLTVNLHPADLGPVQVVAEIRNGEISVRLSGATEAGHDALRDALADLKRDLEDSGFSNCTLDLRQGDAQQEQAREQFGFLNENRAGRESAGRPADDAAAAPASAPARPAGTGTTSRLDVEA